MRWRTRLFVVVIAVWSLTYSSFVRADTKISAMPATTSLAGTDIVPVVTTPGGTPANKTITYTNFLAGVSGSTFTWSGSQTYSSSVTVNSAVLVGQNVTISSTTILPGATFYQGANVVMSGPIVVSSNVVVPGATFYQGGQNVVGAETFQAPGGASIYGNFVSSNSVSGVSGATVTLAGYTRYVIRVSYSNGTATNGVSMFLRFNGDAATNHYGFQDFGFANATSTNTFCGIGSSSAILMGATNDIVQNSGIASSAILNVDGGVVGSRTQVTGNGFYYSANNNSGSFALGGEWESTAPSTAFLFMGLLTGCNTVSIISGGVINVQVWGVF